jgi:Mg2+ and Co2+ transporter CorA
MRIDPLTKDIAIQTVQEDRITIYRDRQLVVFNEVDDSEQTETSEIVANQQPSCGQDTHPASTVLDIAPDCL